MVLNFANKVIWVTGAGQGIGFEICRKFALAGATVFLNDLDGNLSKIAAEKINQEIDKQSVIPLYGDISDPLEIEKEIDEIKQKAGKLDIMIANAGVTHFGEFLTYSSDHFDRVVGVNLRGSYFCAQSAAKLMIEKEIRGRIILMSSVTGVQAHRNLSAYGMTKAAIRMLTRSLALELGPYGITVNALGPGATLTERTKQEGQEYVKGWEKVAPNNATASVKDIAASAMFLASEQAGHITGETLIIDGGWTIHSPLPGDNYEV